MYTYINYGKICMYSFGRQIVKGHTGNLLMLQQLHEGRSRCLFASVTVKYYSFPFFTLYKAASMCIDGYLVVYPLRYSAFPFSVNFRSLARSTALALSSACLSCFRHEFIEFFLFAVHLHFHIFALLTCLPHIGA